MLPFEFVVDGPPVSQQTKNKKNLQRWKVEVRKEAENSWFSGNLPIAEPIKFSVIYFYSVDAADIDNIAKPMQDALQGLAYFDDKQVTDLLGRKRDLNNLRVGSVPGILAEGLGRGNPFLYVRIEEASVQEVFDLWT